MPSDNNQTLTAQTELLIGGDKLKLKLVVPTAEIPAEALMPALHRLCNQVVNSVAETARACGTEISCKKGCGACCRQYVPISPAEARLLTELVEEMPEPRRSAVKQRFADAVERFKAWAGMNLAMEYIRLPPPERVKMVKAYFHLGIACPFLENESCSIYQQRPLICREYLVISSPEHCATLDGEHIKRLKLPVSIAETFSSMEGARRQGVNPCLPLILALEWTDEHPEDREMLTGPKWVQYFFEDLSGEKIPPPEVPQQD
jgi:Fe-S-cluster containining protein